MSWEVPIMRSKNWCCKFSWSVIRKDLTRFWPVWGSYLAIWLLILPIPLLNNAYPDTISMTEIIRDVHRQVVYAAGGEAALVMTAAYGGLAAFAVWSYLYQSRSASLFHALPVTRETLFCSHFTAGLSFLLVPNVLLAAITYLCQAALGYFDPTQILCWLAVVCLESFLFFSLGTLAAMCTGNLPAMPVLYGLINFAVVVYESLLREFSTQLYWGVTSQDLKLTWFSPIVQLAQQSVYVHETVPVFNPDGVYYTESIRYFNPEYLTCLCLYALAALVLVAVSLLLYRRRATESAGDVIAFDFLKPIAKYCFAFGCALVLGWVLQEVIFPSADGVLPRLVCSAVGGAVGYLAAAMLLKKSFRVFRAKELAGLLALWVALVGLFAAFDADLFGVESRVPRAGEVTSVKLNSDYLLTLDLPQDIDSVLALHRSILENKDSLNLNDLRSFDTPYYGDTVHVSFTYALEDGSTLRRSYGMPWDTSAHYDRSTPQGRLEAIMNVPQRLVDSYLPPEDATIASMQLQIGDDQLLNKTGDTFAGHYGSAYVNSDHFNRLLKALEADIRAGRLRAWNGESLAKEYRHLFTIEINYERTIVDPTASEIALVQSEAYGKPVAQTASYWKDIPVYTYDNPSRTLDLLVELGYFSSIPNGYFTGSEVAYD